MNSNARIAVFGTSGIEMALLLNAYTLDVLSFFKKHVDKISLAPDLEIQEINLRDSTPAGNFDICVTIKAEMCTPVLLRLQTHDHPAEYSEESNYYTIDSIEVYAEGEDQPMKANLLNLKQAERWLNL